MQKQSDRPNYRNYEFQQLTLTSPLGKHVLEGSVVYDNDRPQYNVDLKATYGKSKYLVLQGGYENGVGDKEIRTHVGFLWSQNPLYGFKYTLYLKETDKMVSKSVSTNS